MVAHLSNQRLIRNKQSLKGSIHGRALSALVMYLERFGTMTESVSVTNTLIPGLQTQCTSQSHETVVQPSDKRVSLVEIGSSLNYLSKVPLHDQLFDLLKDALSNGRLTEVSDGLLPSTRHMALALSVSRETVSKTISKLAAHGLITANERKRTHVIEHKSLETLMSFETPLEILKSQSIRLDFTPEADLFVEKGSYENNYLIDKYRKTLRRQSTKRHKISSNFGGLASFRQVLASQLKINSNIDCDAEDLIIFTDSRSCLDFILRLMRQSFSNAIIESPASREAVSLLNLHGFKTQSFFIDEFGLDIDSVTNNGFQNCLALVSATLQDPTGVSMSLARKVALMNWARETNSIILDRGSTQGFLRSSDSPALWQISGGSGVCCIWEFASILKPWSQICCAIFPKHLQNNVRHLRSIIGGEVAINEQIAMQEFIEEGDLAKTMKHRELLCLEKRRRLNLAFARLFGGNLSALRINKGSKMVFSLIDETHLPMIVEAAQRVDLPAIAMDLPTQEKHSAKLLIDLDMVALESLSEKIQAFECVLEVYKSRSPR